MRAGVLTTASPGTVTRCCGARRYRARGPVRGTPAGAVVAFADPAAGSDRGGDVARQVQSLRVDEPMCMPQFAPQPDGKCLAGLTISRCAAFDRARHPRVAA